MAESEGTMGEIKERLRALANQTGYGDPLAAIDLIDSLEKQRDEADRYVDQLNVLCEDFGCDAGSDRLAWLHEKLGEVARLTSERDEARAKAIEECATLVEAVRLEFVSAGAEIVASGNPHEIMPEAVADNLTRIASAIRALNVSDLREAGAAIKEAGKS